MQHNLLTRGNKVKVRSFSGEFTERIVWDVKDSGVLVCSERQYEWLQRGDYRAAPIGFKWSDVAMVEAAPEVPNAVL